jgi:prepilin-type processing-associated H-X9-DG protein
MPYLGAIAQGFQNYWEVKVFDCPSYPLKDQTVDYCTNAFNLKGSMSEFFGFSKLDDFPRHTTTVYMADYEYIPDVDHVKIILKDDPPDLMKRKMQSLDVWHPKHLPTADDTTRRVARDRHGKWISCLYVDGHSEKVKPLEMTVYDWGLPAELLDP